MASPNATFTEIVTTTLRNHPSEVADNVSNHNALYRRLKEKKQIKMMSGGYEIAMPLDYQENSTYQRFSGYDVLDVGASDVLTSAKYDWVQAAVHVTASGDELRKNSGDEKIIDFTEARIKNAMRTAANNMSVDLYSSGSLSNQMGGLAHIIQNDGTGTVGGIVSGTYTWWKNQFLEITGTGTYTSATLPGFMETLWLSCVRGTDMPDLIVSSNDFYSLYWESTSNLQRYSSDSKESANRGFPMLKFNQADIIHDLNSNFSASAEKMYYLNTDYLQLAVHEDANWTQMDEKAPTNQDAVVIPLIWQGQLCCSNRARQGVLIDAA